MSVQPADAISVVVPSIGRRELLARCLGGLARQDYPPAEVLVVASGEPGVTEVVAAWQPRLPVRLLEVPARGVSQRRNAGWRAASSPVIAFTDDDCEPTPGWLDGLHEALGTGAELVCGPICPHPGDTGVRGVFARTVQVDGDDGIYPGANLALTRASLEATGGFDPGLAGGEDSDLAWRARKAGARAAYAPTALVYHAVRPVSFPAHLWSLGRWVGLPTVARRHPELRAHAFHRFWWKPTHPSAAACLVAVALSPWRPRLALLAAGHLAWRIRHHGIRAGAELTVSDLTEVAVLAAGSLRARTLLL